MDQEFEFWFRNPREVARRMLASLPTEKVPYEEYREAGMRVEMMHCALELTICSDGDRVYQDFMSGKWCWREAVSLLSSLPLSDT
jgi:N-methylhydantoinase B/oxoprolinase/acetone carboxylase alpha subunit